MGIEKLKAEFEQSECFKRLEHVAQYTFFEFGAYIKRTDVPADIEKKCGKLNTALLFSWSAWKEAKAQSDQKIKLLLCDEHLKKCESPTGVFNSQYPDEEPCLICLAKETKAQAVPEWISMEDKYPKAGESVLICINGIRQNIAYFYDCSVSNEYSDHDWFEPVFTGGEAGDECVVKTEDVTHWMLLPKEPAND